MPPVHLLNILGENHLNHWTGPMLCYIYYCRSQTGDLTAVAILSATEAVNRGRQAEFRTPISFKTLLNYKKKKKAPSSATQKVHLVRQTSALVSYAVCKLIGYALCK